MQEHDRKHAITVHGLKLGQANSSITCTRSSPCAREKTLINSHEVQTLDDLSQSHALGVEEVSQLGQW